MSFAVWKFLLSFYLLSFITRKYYIPVSTVTPSTALHPLHSIQQTERLSYSTHLNIIFLFVCFRCENILLRIAFFSAVFTIFRKRLKWRWNVDVARFLQVHNTSSYQIYLLLALLFCKMHICIMYYGYKTRPVPIYLLNEMVFSFYYDDVGYIINFHIWFNI